MRRRLIGLGLDPESFELVDGSGLSYEDRASPRAFVTALQVARASFRFGPELLSALPIAARDGTLRKRTRDSVDRVRGKTGLLNQVTGLSGFAQLSAQEGSQEIAIFSILVNGYRGTDEQAMAEVDRFAAELLGER
jgi:D-alanyl-D-alanine carboxypeptidase/D-alanyl-D-alanine-endopeptidase (penicillin-binding protein 4)